MLRKLKPRKFARSSLVSLYGVNVCTAIKILGLLGIHPRAIHRNLNRRYKALVPVLGLLRISFRLRLIVFSRICLQMFTVTYRGIRRSQGLPSKGQRTHANAKTARRLRANGASLPFSIRLARVRAQAIQRTEKFRQIQQFKKTKKYATQQKFKQLKQKSRKGGSTKAIGKKSNRKKK